MVNYTDTESVQPTAQNVLETTPAGGALVVSRTARALAEASIAPNTRAAYASALRSLDDWLAGRPATDETLAGYLSELFDAGKASASASMVVAAVRFRARLSGLESPTGPPPSACLQVSGARPPDASRTSETLSRRDPRTAATPRKTGARNQTGPRALEGSRIQRLQPCYSRAD